MLHLDQPANSDSTSVWEILVSKHPPCQPASPDSTLHGPPPEIHVSLPLKHQVSKCAGKSIFVCCICSADFWKSLLYSHLCHKELANATKGHLEAVLPPVNDFFGCLPDGLAKGYGICLAPSKVVVCHWPVGWAGVAGNARSLGGSTCTEVCLN